MELSALSIVIPAYNESRRIVKTLREIKGFCDKNALLAEMIIVNDGSKDNTAQVANDFFGAQKINGRVINLQPNQGKGAAVRAGVLASKGEWILVMDADSATPIDDLQRLEKEQGEATVVFGSRYLDRSLLEQRQPLTRRLIGRLGNIVARSLLGIKLVDTQCGFKLFHREAAQAIFRRTKIDRWGWDMEALVIANELHLLVKEVPVTWQHVEGSKMRAFGGAWQTMKEIFTIRRNKKNGLYK